MLDPCRFLSWFRLDYFLTGECNMNISQKQQFKVKTVLIMDLSLTYTQLLASQDVNRWTGVVWITCGLLWCFYQLFGLSFWRHPFTAEDPLVSKWCNATFLQIWWRNKLIYILDGLRVSTFSTNFHLYVNYCLFIKKYFNQLFKMMSALLRWSQSVAQ